MNNMVHVEILRKYRQITAFLLAELSECKEEKNGEFKQKRLKDLCARMLNYLMEIDADIKRFDECVLAGKELSASID